MGKRTRRNNKRKGNKASSNTNNSPYQDPSGSGTHNDSSSEAPPSVILQRIRHADPRTRHAALAAVANTLLDTSTTTTRTHYPKVSPTLLQAIRERIMDSDLDVCQVAAGCLANYVTICSSVASVDANQVSQQQAMTAGWILVLVGRLKHSYQQVAQIMNSQKSVDNNTNSSKHPHPKNNTTIKQQKQWLALAVQCLRTLCTLMETNPQAVQRLTSSLDATPRHDFHQALLEWMLQGQQFWQQQPQPAATTTTPSAAAAAAISKDQHAAKTSSAVEQHDAAMRSYYEQILTLSARTLHSAWDDNADLLVPWKEECPDAFRRGMELVQSIMTPSTPPPQALPVVAQLHATGAFLAARPLLLEDSLQAALVTQQQIVISQLTQRLTAFSWTAVQSLLENDKEAYQKWEQEQADDALERDIIRKVQDRKEPARAIARRQKAQRDSQEGMEDDEDEKEGNTKQQEQQDTMDNDNHAAQEVETREGLEQAREEWNKFLLPLQLSLELLANLTSSNTDPVDGEGDDDDDDMMMMEDWGPDQEARWMQEQQMHPAGKQHPTKASNDEVLHKTLIESPLPQHLVHLFRQVYQVPPPAVNFPEQSRHDLQDLQSKTVACLGNGWENISSWPIHDLSWTELQQAATTSIGLGKEALVSALVIALKTYPSLRKEWKPEHLAVWLQELQPPAKQQQDGSNIGNISNSLSIRRDVISMLGVLCSQEPHPVTVNQQVCTALLLALTNCSDDDYSIAIQCEVLNVLMDMYGNDEEDGCCHPSVFESLQVLGHFQRCIPPLKSKLKLREKKLKSMQSITTSSGGTDDNRVELEQWKETVLNANRFIQYKKGQL